MRRGVCLTDCSWINRLPHFNGEIATDGKWLDIGTPNRLKLANEMLKEEN